MLRIHQSSNVDAALGYYTKGLSHADYYTGHKSPSYWGGKAAERLGLSGEVMDRDFKMLVLNKNPMTSEQLNPHNSRNRRVGYDFTFNASKSLSMAIEFTKDEVVKKEIMDSWYKALNDTMKEIETGMQTRDHKGLFTTDVETGNMVWASFTHDRSRPIDGIPQMHLHQHVYVFNTTWFEKKGRFQAGQFGQIKKDAPYYEAVFHNHLAKNLLDKGFTITRTKDRFELVGISREGIETFSERTKQIEAFIEKNNITNQSTKSKIGAALRDSKSEQKAEAEIQEHWNRNLSASDRTAIDNLKQNPDGTPHISARVALAHAIEHEFERKSVVNEKRLIATALKYGIGTVTVDDIREEFKAQGVLTATDKKGQILATTRQVLNEEKQMIAFAKAGRGLFRPLTSQDAPLPDYFTQDQKQAVHHIWHSQDAVTIVEGKAGVGKTTMMKKAVEVIEKEDKQVFALAPTSSATTMLGEEGFSHNHTLAKFLDSEELQSKAKNQVIWLDEAGMVGVRDMHKLFEIARKQDMRIILTGDTRQHHSVQRGDAMRLLVNQSGVPVAEVGEIQRQKRLSYRRAVGWLSKGFLKDGFAELDRMGSIKEINDNSRYTALATDYVNTIQNGLSALVVTPTHSEKAKVTEEIRNQLKASGMIKGTELNVTIFKNLQLSNAQKKDTKYYEEGQKIQLTQHIKGFTKGEKLTVLAVKDNNTISIKQEGGSIKSLPLTHTDRFNLYQTDTIKVAVGDMIRITQNGTSQVGGVRNRLNNGSRYKIAAFTEQGDIITDSGTLIHRNYHNLDYGVVTNSHSSQGATVDKVIISNSSESFGLASNLEQFYVSASRGKHQLSLYTDNKAQLLQQVSKSSERLSATELLQNRHGFWRSQVEKAIDLYKRTVANETNSYRKDQGMSPSRA